MKIGIIGAGKLGCALAIGLKKKSYELSGVYSKNSASTHWLASRLGIKCSNNLKETVKNSDIVFITVPDGQIEGVALEIAKDSEFSDVCGKSFFHCSGALSSDHLLSLSELGAYTASFHPIQTFADREESWRGLEGISFGFEGCKEAREKAEILAETFKSSILIIRKEDKPLYHAAACILSNYTVTLSYMAGKLFENIGIPPVEGLKAFAPLVLKTLYNIGELGSLGALTGPISRGDSAVVEKHLKEMEMKSREIVSVYKAMGKMTVEAALEKGSIDQDSANKLFEILN